MFYFILDGNPGSSTELPEGATLITEEQYNYCISNLTMLSIQQGIDGVVIELDIEGYRREAKATLNKMFSVFEPNFEVMSYLSMCVNHGVQPFIEGKTLYKGAADLLVGDVMRLYSDSKYILHSLLGDLDTYSSAESIDKTLEYAKSRIVELCAIRDSIGIEEIYKNAK